MNRKRFMRCRLPRRCGAVLLAAALSLSMLGTGSAFADTTETGEEIVEMTVSGDYEASIDEAGGYVYYAFTPEVSGTYSFYTTGDYDTYAYIYDADWNELDSNDDSGSSLNAKITISLEAGNTYYIAIRFYSSDTTGSFNVYAEKVLAAVSAELVLSQELVLYEGIDSYDEYDDNDEVFEYYEMYELNFTSGDQIVLTLEDGSTVTYTSYGSRYFYDENDEYLSYSVSSDQYSEHWEVGNTYYFTYTLTDYAIDVQIPVTIAANPYADATVEFVSEEGLTLYEGIDSYTDYDDNDEEFEYYSYWNLSFSDSDQIVITLNDGSTITYTADGYGNFYDEDGNYLNFDVSSRQYREHWEIGGTYYYTLTLSDYGLTVQIPVTIAENPYADATVEFVSEEGLTLYEGIDSYTYYDDNDEEFEYYSCWNLSFSSSDQIVITLSDGSTITYTSAGYGVFYDEDGSYLSFYYSSDQYSEHWEVGGTYYFTLTLSYYGLTVQIPVTIAANPYADATVEFVSEEGLTLYEGIDSYTDYDDNDEEFEYYSYWNLSFSSSDQIVITLSDGSTITYTSDGYGDFYDEDGSYLSFYYSSDQYSEHWEAGGTYYFTLTLSDYGLTVQIPVTIVAPDFTSAEEMAADTAYTAVIEEAGGFVIYSFTPSETGTYTTYSTGEYDTYAYIFDADGNKLSYNDGAGDDYNALITIDLDAGSTYYIVYRFYSASTTGSFNVYTELTGSSESDNTGSGDENSDTNTGSGDENSGGTTDDDSSSDNSGTDGDGSTSDDDGSNGDNSDNDGSNGDTLDDDGSNGDNSDDDGSNGDASDDDGSNSDNSDDDGSNGDNSDDDGSNSDNSDNDGSNGDNSDDNDSSDDSGQTNGGSVKLKTQKITVKKAQLKKTIKYKKLKKKAQTFKLKASTSGNGKITYKKVSGNKKIKVSKAGKVTVKKGLKKGKTYKVKVKITAAKTSSYKKASVTKTIKIKIK